MGINEYDTIDSTLGVQARKVLQDLALCIKCEWTVAETVEDIAWIQTGATNENWWQKET